jgi:hypothetical protein
MPCRYGATPEYRVRIELVEADLEIGFTLVDLAASSPGDSLRLLADAQQVYAAILARVDRLHSPERDNFQPLVAELRRAIELATRRLLS